jgi:hypothetical protein
MGHILHDWDLDEKRLLVAKPYEALPTGGALIVYDAIIDVDRLRRDHRRRAAAERLRAPDEPEYADRDARGLRLHRGGRLRLAARGGVP